MQQKTHGLNEALKQAQHRSAPAVVKLGAFAQPTVAPALMKMQGLT